VNVEDPVSFAVSKIRRLLAEQIDNIEVADSPLARSAVLKARRRLAD